ncbi:unnamed protein product [Ixodes hexagonus]
MWSQVQAVCPPASPEGPTERQRSSGPLAPSSRSKHAMCISQDGCFYLLAGRSANLPLKDLWRFDPVQSRWEEVRCRGSRPPCLQEHSVVSWKGKLYVFGGEIGFASTGETPLWIFDTGTSLWRKQQEQGRVGGTAGRQPSGRRGHTCVIYNGAMHLFGGYQDLKGSSAELWGFHFEQPLHRWPRNIVPSYTDKQTFRFVSPLLCECGIYGGLSDLQERADFWSYHFESGRWSRVRPSKGGPGELHGHAAVQAQGCMYLFGGEHQGTANNDLWRFHFASETWEKVLVDGTAPTPRCRHVALVNPSMPTWADRVRPSAADVDGDGLWSAAGEAGGDGQPRRASFRFKVHPVSRLCSKRTGSQDEEEDRYAYGGQLASQVNLRSLKEKLSSSRLVRSISSGNYGVGTVRRDELQNLLDGGDSSAGGTPRLQPSTAIQKSLSSDAVLEPSDSESSTPRHQIKIAVRPLSEILPRNRDEDVMPGRLSPPPQSGRSRRMTSSQSLTTFSARGHNAVAPVVASSCCCSPTAVSSATNPPEHQHSPCENDVTSVNAPTTADRTDLLIDLDSRSSAKLRQARRSTSSYTSFSTLSDGTGGGGSCLQTPVVELSHSVSHCSGYYSFAEDDPELQRDIVNFLTGNGPRSSRPVSLNAGGGGGGRSSTDSAVVEMNTFSVAAQPGIQVVKQRARSWDRVSQRVPSGSSTAVVIRGSGQPRTHLIQAIKEESCHGTPVRVKLSSPSRGRPEQHRWRLCFYVFGGSEQGAPGLYRQPISIWQLYI